MRTLEIPDDMIAQVLFAFRQKANEFHGALARDPNSSAASSWRRTAEWLDAEALKLAPFQALGK